ncbi:GNAT family N-acetyltransferase [Kribbella monticola]|uniref:GNAT family N-acetyltransferase n=1 Tax=Kribbella monticola TaxID=2185285 RepID=UPI0013007287
MRPGTADDAQALLALRSEVLPYRVLRLTDLRSSLEDGAADEHYGSFAVEEDDRLVGWASAALSTWSPEPGEYHVVLLVHPDYRRQGIGTTLAESLDELLIKQNARRVVGSATDDGVDSLCSKGFRPPRSCFTRRSTRGSCRSRPRSRTVSS